jgi:hypothetical protein
MSERSDKGGCTCWECGMYLYLAHHQEICPQDPINKDCINQSSQTLRKAWKEYHSIRSCKSRKYLDQKTFDYISVDYSIKLGHKFTKYVLKFLISVSENSIRGDNFKKMSRGDDSRIGKCLALEEHLIIFEEKVKEKNSTLDEPQIFLENNDSSITIQVLTRLLETPGFLPSFNRFPKETVEEMIKTHTLEDDPVAYKNLFEEKVTTQSKTDQIYGDFTEEIMTLFEDSFDLVCENIIWFDETQLNFLNIKKQHKRKKGQDFANSSESSKHFTFSCLIAGNLNEIFKPWMLYPKSRKKGHKFEYESVKNRSDLFIYESISTHVVAEDMFVVFDWWFHNHTYDAPIFVIEDSASAHRAVHGKSLMSYLEYDNFEHCRDDKGSVYDVSICTIPGGLTGKFQAMDMAGSTFGSLKQKFRHNLGKYFTVGFAGGLKLENEVILQTEVTWGKSSEIPLGLGLDIFTHSLNEIKKNVRNPRNAPEDTITNIIKYNRPYMFDAPEDTRTNFVKYNRKYMLGCGIVFTCGVGLSNTNSKIFKYLLIEPQSPLQEPVDIQNEQKKLANFTQQNTVKLSCPYCGLDQSRTHKKNANLELHKLICKENPNCQNPTSAIEMRDFVKKSAERRDKIIATIECFKDEILQKQGVPQTYKNRNTTEPKSIRELRELGQRSFSCLIENCDFMVRDMYTKRFQSIMFHHWKDDHTKIELANHERQMKQFAAVCFQKASLNKEKPKSSLGTPMVYDPCTEIEKIVTFSNKGNDNTQEDFDLPMEEPAKPRRRKSKNKKYMMNKAPKSVLRAYKKYKIEKKNPKKKKKYLKKKEIPPNITPKKRKRSAESVETSESSTPPETSDSFSSEFAGGVEGSESSATFESSGNSDMSEFSEGVISLESSPNADIDEENIAEVEDENESSNFPPSNDDSDSSNNAFAQNLLNSLFYFFG